MMPSDAFYVLIPLTNGLANIALKLSVEEMKSNRWQRFAVMQLIGYSTFIVVVVFSYLFLLTHAANLYVVLFASNYIATLYLSRWFLNESYSVRDVAYDALVIAGIAIFYLGAGSNVPV